MQYLERNRPTRSALFGYLKNKTKNKNQKTNNKKANKQTNKQTNKQKHFLVLLVVSPLNFFVLMIASQRQLYEQSISFSDYNKFLVHKIKKRTWC